MARAPAVAATLPCGDAAGQRALEAALEVGAEDLAQGAAGGALGALQAHLFEGTAPVERSLDDEVVVLSAPGESRECVEIARRIHGLDAYVSLWNAEDICGRLGPVSSIPISCHGGVDPYLLIRIQHYANCRTFPALSRAEEAQTVKSHREPDTSHHAG